MSIYTDIEQAVADRLAPFGAADFDVRVLPEKQSEYEQRPFGTGRITVAYHSSKFDEHNSIGAATSQFEEVTIALAIQSRFLRGPKGIYTIAGIVRRYLVGFEPGGQDPMWAKEFGLKDASHEDNLWTYYAHYCTRTMAVQDVPADESALLQLIQFDNNFTGESSTAP